MSILVIIIGCTTIMIYRRKLNRLTENQAGNQRQYQETTVLFQNNRQPRILSSTSNRHARSLTTAPQSGISRSIPHDRSSSTVGQAYHSSDRVDHSEIENDHDYGMDTVNTESDRRQNRLSLQPSIRPSNDRRQSLRVQPTYENRERSWSRKPGQRLERNRDTRTIVGETVNLPHHVQPVSAINTTTSSQQPTTSNASLLDIVQQVLSNSQTSPINYPAPPKFNKNMNIDDWTREMDLYIELTNIRDRKKIFYWAYLDETTRKMLRSLEFDEDDEIALDQLKRKFSELFGKIRKQPLEHMKEFNNRTQQQNENVRVYGIATARKASFSAQFEH